ncbi:MAG: sn-glycerol-3-phosphate import ATP-binding protein UgpC [Candidatus Erwinia impunctatus]|nr:sn-glycerol-3-phosphate import ATP-binding protein UgpC [Culicoides impunctatus]
MRLELQQLHRRLNTTSLYVTHDQVEAMTLAQRVMVMNRGVLEQLGTPVEIYERPATRFVASFIGAPAMNLLDVDVSDDGSLLQLAPGITLPLSHAMKGWAGKSIILGIRPEHIQQLPAEAQGIPLQVETLEMLGADNLAHGRIGQHRVVIRLPHNERPDPGTVLWLDFPLASCHFFDPQQGVRRL